MIKLTQLLNEIEITNKGILTDELKDYFDYLQLNASENLGDDDYSEGYTYKFKGETYGDPENQADAHLVKAETFWKAIDFLKLRKKYTIDDDAGTDYTFTTDGKNINMYFKDNEE